MPGQKISIIICTLNRLPYLKKSIGPLLALDFPDFEIIIVNDGSTDGTKEFLNSLTDTKIKVIHNEKNLGLSRARNVGIAAAGGNILVFTDDDCCVTPKWLTHIATAFDDKQIDFVIGETRYISDEHVGYFPERLVSNKGARWPMGCNIAYRKKVFDDIGDFDHDFFRVHNEDTEMAVRAVSHGCRYRRVPEAVVYHQTMDWTATSLLSSASNGAVWPMLKKKYPGHYRHFGSPVLCGTIVSPKEYLLIFLAPIAVPLFLLRYLLHGKRNLRLFFTKWPIYLFLRRYAIWREAIRQHIFMI